MFNSPPTPSIAGTNEINKMFYWLPQFCSRQPFGYGYSEISSLRPMWWKGLIIRLWHGFLSSLGGAEFKLKATPICPSCFTSVHTKDRTRRPAWPQTAVSTGGPWWVIFALPARPQYWLALMDRRGFFIDWSNLNDANIEQILSGSDLAVSTIRGQMGR